MLKHFAGRKQIAYPLLSDADSGVIRRFGILNTEVPESSPFRGIPHPVTYIVSRDGVIQSAHFEEDFRNRPTVGTILSEPAPGVAGMRFRSERLTLTATASDGTVRGGDRVRLFVTVRLAPRMHVYAPGVEGYIPVDWKMAEAGSAKAHPVNYPAGKKVRLPAIGETVPVYEKEFTLVRDVVLPAKPEPAQPELTLSGTFRYQACDDRKCYIPEEIPLKWTFRLEAHDSARVPEELRRKVR